IPRCRVPRAGRRWRSAGICSGPPGSSLHRSRRPGSRPPSIEGVPSGCDRGSPRSSGTARPPVCCKPGEAVARRPRGRPRAPAPCEDRAHVLEVLRDAIDAAAWPRALEVALEAWRALRAPELADLVEALGARCVAEVVPPPARPEQRHAWWIECAARYDPAAVTYLASQAHPRADAREVTRPALRARWGDANPLIATLLEGSPRWFDAVSPSIRLDAVDRLAAILTWPPDPRAAPLLA